MASNGFEHLLASMQETLRRGKIILFSGWRDSNHSSFTRKLPSSKVRFTNQIPREIPVNVGLVIFTRFTTHVQRHHAKRVIRDGEVYPHLVETGIIKQLLKQCTECTEIHHAPDAEPLEVDEPETPVAIAASPPEKERIMSIETIDLNLPDVPRSPEERFAREFIELAGHEDGGMVSIYRTRELIRKHFGDAMSPQTLIDQGLIAPKVTPGQKKVGQYTAGEKLLEIMSAPPPSDPMERARWLIEQEPELEAEQARLQARMREVLTALERIEKAKELIKQKEEQDKAFVKQLDELTR